MTPAEKRVAIAKDVLAHLAAGKIKAKKGTYFSNAILSKGVRGTEDVGRVLKEKVPTCDVCARGALFVAAVRRADRLKVEDLFFGMSDKPKGVGFHIARESIFRYNEGFFERSQEELIESAFEQEPFGPNGHLAMGFMPKSGPKARMVGIMRNIIKNNGEFVPPAGAARPFTGLYK